MSRFPEYEDLDEYWALNVGRWERNSRAVVRSKRGQKALRELKEALLAMPFKALIDHKLIEVPMVYDEGVGELVPAPYYEVCAIGQYALHKGKDPKWMMDQTHFVFDSTEEYDDDRGEMTIEMGESLGMRRTLAVVIADINDEAYVRNNLRSNPFDYRSATPEDRWHYVMLWIDYNLKN